MDTILPNNVLRFFPVQYFSQRAWSARSSLSQGSGPAQPIFFSDSFGGTRTSLAGTTAHRAIDIMAPRGLPVFATSQGVVPSTWTVFQEVAPNIRRGVQMPGIGTASNPVNGDGGNYVVLVDSSGRHHYYAHLSYSPSVAIGELVQAGQLIGYVGNTGRRAQYTQPHLHYQVTTRPRRDVSGTLTFWNPFRELGRLAVALGGVRRGARIEVPFAAFVTAIGTRSGAGLINPWDSIVTPEIVNPWDMAF